MINKNKYLHDISGRRRLLVVGAAWPALAWTGALHAQAKPDVTRAGNPVRVGILAATSKELFQLQEQTFVNVMHELGWIENRNITYERFYGDNDATRLPVLAGELVARGPDLIFVMTTPQALAVFAKTRTIPMVVAALGSPVESGLVQSLSRPGSNVTGMGGIGWELSGKRMQLLKETLPKMGRVGVLVETPREDVLQEQMQEQKLIESAATKLGVTATFANVKQPAELDAAFASLLKHRVDAVLIANRPIFLNQRKRIVELAAKHRLPVFGGRGEFVDVGALMSYGASLTEQIRRVAQLADKILKGTKPADIPVEQPMKFELAINMKTAKTLGITIPKLVLVQTTRVIE